MLIAAQTGSTPLAGSPERRSKKRHVMVLRVGVLSDDQRTSFCLVRNISSGGVEVKLYATVKVRSQVRLTVGDEELILGKVTWVRGESAGIKFDQPLDPHRLLRATRQAAPSRRRSSPRVSVAARAILRTNGQTLSAQLSDISPSGAKVRTPRRLTEGRSVSLMLPDLPAIMAFVRWAGEEESGLVFHTPVPVHMLAPWLAQRLRVVPLAQPAP